MKQKINWLILLCASYLILLLDNCKNLKYLPNLIKELGKLFEKGSKYTEDGDFMLIPKPKQKEF